LLSTWSGTGTGDSIRSEPGSRGVLSGFAACVGCRSVSIFDFAFSHAKLGEGAKKSKNVQEPQNHGNNYDGIQNLLDRTRHWYVAIHQP
jgi:hypothetical protein